MIIWGKEPLLHKLHRGKCSWVATGLVPHASATCGRAGASPSAIESHEMCCPASQCWPQSVPGKLETRTAEEAVVLLTG